MATAPTPPPSIDSLSPTPNRATDTPAEFSNKTDTFLNELDPFGAQQNTLADWSYATALISENNANESATSANASASSASDSATSATLSQSTANYKGLWSSLTGALNQPACVFNDGAFWVLNTDLADVTLSEPTTGNADWEFLSGTRWGSTVTASQTPNPNSLIMVEATSGAVDLTLSGFAEGDFLVVHNSSASTQQVRLLNPSYTIRGLSQTASAGNNIVLDAGYPFRLIARSASILEAS